MPLQTAPSQTLSRGKTVALAVCLICNLQLLHILSVYYSILSGPAMSSRMEGTSGLREMARGLGAVAVVATIAAARRPAPRWFLLLAQCLAVAAVFQLILIEAVIRSIRSALGLS